MPERIPNSVAKRVVFRAIGSSDHVTPATAKTISVTISKNGGAFGNPAAGATSATEISSGFYYFDLGTGDTATAGPLAWRGAGTGIDDVGDVYEVVSAANAGFSALPDTACATNGSLITAGTGTAQLSVSAGRANADVINWNGSTAPAMTGDAFARLGAPAGASIAADIAAVPTATQNADALLNRDMGVVSDTNARSPLNALRFIRNKWSIAGTTLTVTKEDDSTSAWTATVSTSSGAQPVVGNDPA